ncbi:bursicon-like [Topomyia yanbarensis]|uniref:bursicon-like n=1 Tax=Topomyia yanbarensis TaxID=2498891 RepID=UPI00273ABD5C|nr:bursicon-like [Topomyia yanbarensis]
MDDSTFKWGNILVRLFEDSFELEHSDRVIRFEDDIQHYSADDCQVTPVIHVLQYPGCVPKPIPSFACVGRCASYIQVSGSKIWQMERSCMCCQESGEREASVSLFCPKAKNGEKKFKKVHHPLCT